jgi:hypothetical protein
LYNLVVLQVKGRSDLFLKLEIVKKIMLVIIMFISFFYGFYALLWGQLLASILALFINTHYAGKMLKYSMAEQLKDIFPIFAFALLMGLVCYSVNIYFANYDNIIRLVAGSVSGLCLYAAAAFIFKFQSIQDIKNLISKK